MGRRWMGGRRWIGAAALSLAMAGPPAAASAAPGAPGGVWIGPHADVAVRTAPCGDRLCGWVVWATPAARANASQGGTAQLIGTRLLDDYVADGARRWSGTLFVPDMGRRVASHIEQLSATQMRVQGCILGGLLCRTQTWHRIDRLPDA